MPTIAVIGGTGFIGRHVVVELLARGHEVLCVARNPMQQGVPGARYLAADIGADADCAVADADIVIHLASVTNPVSAAEDPAFDIRSNLLSSLSLLDACRRRHVRRLVFCSSGGTVYGPTRVDLIDEHHPTSPISPYGIVKLAVERYTAYYGASFGLEYVILRCANAYGPGQRPGRAQGVVAELLTSMALERDFDVWGDGSAVRDYTYVADIAKAFALAVESECVNRAYNIGTGVGTTLLDLIRSASDTAGLVPRIRYRPGPAHSVSRNVLDPALAGGRLGWKPEVGLTTGLKLTWDWILQSGPRRD